MTNTSFSVAVAKPRDTLHISKMADGVYVHSGDSGSGDMVYLKKGELVTIINKGGFHILKCKEIGTHLELFPAKWLSVNACMWGPYEE
ncbi:hypothetical protein U47_09 [Pseudomonas phage U47]|nr:hypothetical protein U47_09 [Pseudomonas phage U47]